MNKQQLAAKQAKAAVAELRDFFQTQSNRANELAREMAAVVGRLHTVDTVGDVLDATTEGMNELENSQLRNTQFAAVTRLMAEVMNHMHVAGDREEREQADMDDELANG